MPQETGVRLWMYNRPGAEFWGPDAQERALMMARSQGATNYRFETITRYVALERENAIAFQSGRYVFLDPVTGRTVVVSAQELEQQERKRGSGSVYESDDDTSPRQQGLALGRSLATLIGISAAADFEAMQTLGMWFAELHNYRDMRQGTRFVAAFMEGFKSETETLNGDSKRLDAPPSVTPPP